jgi:hypothetical protein
VTVKKGISKISIQINKIVLYAMSNVSLASINHQIVLNVRIILLENYLQSVDVNRATSKLILQMEYARNVKNNAYLVKLIHQIVLSVLLILLEIKILLFVIARRDILKNLQSK